MNFSCGADRMTSGPAGHETRVTDETRKGSASERNVTQPTHGETYGQGMRRERHFDVHVTLRDFAYAKLHEALLVLAARSFRHPFLAGRIREAFVEDSPAG